MGYYENRGRIANTGMGKKRRRPGDVRSRSMMLQAEHMSRTEKLKPKPPQSHKELMAYIGWMIEMCESGEIELGMLRVSNMLAKKRHLFKK